MMKTLVLCALNTTLTEGKTYYSDSEVMVPRAVLMAKEVTAFGVPASQGNILAANYYSWQNNSYSYYTSGAKQGFGTGYLFDVRSFSGFYTLMTPTSNVYTLVGDPKWGQPPVRKGSGVGSFLYPKANSTTPPPIDTL